MTALKYRHNGKHDSLLAALRIATEHGHPVELSPAHRRRLANNALEPSSSGILRGGNHRSHCAASPTAHVSRSAGSGLRCSGRNRRTLSRNHVIDPIQSTRSAITVAVVTGCSASSARSRDSNGVNDVGAGLRSYFGGRSEATARDTVDLPIPRSRAT